jgi:RNA polymerase sigma factor for flagellar operon FliA
LADQLAFDDWVRAQMPLVKSIARQLKLRLPSSVEEGDLLQWGLLGLIQARKRYTGRQSHFPAFARRRIQGAMFDGLRELDPAPRQFRRTINQIVRNRAELEQTLGRQPSGAEIAKRSGLSLSQYYRLQSEHEAYVPVVLESEEELFGYAHACFTTEPMKLLIEECARRQLHEAVALLPKRERMVLYWRLNDHLKLRRIATKLGLTESRVCQLLAATSQCLRLSLAEDEAGRLA